MNPSALTRPPFVTRPALVLCCLVMIPWAHSAAQQTQQPQSTPSIQVDVNRVLVPVVARDKHGNAIGDLKKGDFQVFDRGKPRAISAFIVESHTLQKTSPAIGSENPQPAPAPASAGSAAQTSSPPLPQRFLVFLFDDLHLSFEDLAYVQKAGVKAMAEVLTGSDIAVVVTTSGTINSGFTRDRAKLQSAIMSLKPLAPRQTGTCPPTIGYYEAELASVASQADDSVPAPAGGGSGGKSAGAGWMASAVAASGSQQADSTSFNGGPGGGALVDVIKQEMACHVYLTGQEMQEIKIEAVSLAQRTAAEGRLNVLSTYATIEEFVRQMATLPGHAR